ncbi:respiratory chain complex I subunit 1 family protein [Caedibacter taeniospiralis]|jgi:formate hydrogenlyase subunit 4|uniref:respiratory chain complex I subunit 1 family protein n=1 Tax=Caedibacter taeniospiralis TaxID=28907 RepID=UPI0037BF66DB
MIMTVVAILQGMLVIALAPLVVGVLHRFKCWLQNRSSPSVLQPYLVFLKLLIKEPILPLHASWIFRFAPFISITLLAMLSFAVPFFIPVSLLSAHIDIIVFVGVLALARVSVVLAAMDIGSAFGSLGARREIFVASLVEPVLLLVLLNLALLTHGLTLDHIALTLIQKVVLYPSLAFSLCAFVMVFLAENGRFPFDNPNTHLELTMVHEAMILEYSGRYLAVIEWANSLRLLLFLLVFINLFFPFGLSQQMTLLSVFIGVVSTIVKLVLLLGFLAILETYLAKVRIFRIPEYLGLALFLAFLGLIVTQLIGG